ncbi:MAG: hypothetical protein RH949_11945 [Coleofasciculus sp. A1-SPW-01]|uniref:hypothetical protein n=1 Tax=Coleofasciculus sp. A1-SPW-01 TaxID=3070819 RepID=UPI0032F88293
MQVTVNLPEKLTAKVQDKWRDLPQEILRQLVLKAFREGLIDFEEFRELGTFAAEGELHEFLRYNNMLHNSGLLNLYGCCAEDDFEVDDLGVDDSLDDDLEGVFDES